VTATPKTTNLWNVLQLLVWGLGLLYVFSRLIPCHPVDDYACSILVDNAWAQVMQVAFAQHMQFGRDIVFTYGPWGFLARGYYPATWLISVLAWLALSLVFICAGWRVTRYFTKNHVIAWLWLVAFAAMSSIPPGNDIGERLTAWGLLLLFLHFLVEDEAFSPLQAALAFTLGWLGLVKFTGLMEGGLLVAVIAVNNIRRRRFPWIIPVWLGGILFFWLLAGQHLGLLWPFLKNSWLVASGYTDAMSEGNALLNPLLYLLIGLGFCVLGARLIRPPRQVSGTLFVLGISGILFLSFKQGYVREDAPHEITAGLTLILTGLACVAVAATRKRCVLITSVGLLCASVAFTIFAPERKNTMESFLRQSVETFSVYNLFCPVFNLFPNRLQNDYGKELAEIREGTPLPSIQGNADLYSCRQDVLFANGLSYRPRPVIQSYSAYTPELAGMNANWLRGGHGAPVLFFAMQEIDDDDRFPSLDDALSWPELLTRYDIKSLSDKWGSYLCLSRSPVPREYHLQLLQETNVTLGEPFALPSSTNGPIWAEVEINKTFAGDLLSFFYKPTTLSTSVKLADRSQHLCRIIPGIARAGFLLSPYIANNRSFVALAKADESVLSRKAIVSMTIFESEEPGFTFCYRPQIKIWLYRLNFPAQSPKINFLKRVDG
jgi:hypothetical protein